MLTMLAVFAFAYLMRFQNPWLPYEHSFSLPFYSSIAFWTIPLWFGVFALYGLYDLDMLFGGVYEYSRAGHACTTGVVVLILYSFLYRGDYRDIEELSRAWLIFLWLISIGSMTAERFLIRRVVYGLRQAGYFRRRVLILGANPEGEAVAEQLVSAPTAGLEVVGLVGRRKSDLIAEAMSQVGLDAMGFGSRRLTDQLPGRRSNLGFPAVECEKWRSVR